MARRKAREPHTPVQNHVLPLGALTAHPDNFRAHPEAQIERLMASLQRFGQVRSVVVQELATGEYLIVAGHGLVEAARRLEMPSMRADVVDASWSAQDVVGYLISDNLSSQGAQDDEVLLADLIERQQLAGYALASLGTSQDDLDALRERIAQRALHARQQADDPSDQDPEDDGADWGEEDDDEGSDPFASGNAPADPYGPHGEAGALLERLNLDLLEPRYTVSYGDVWRVGSHVLVVADVFRDWALYDPWKARLCQEALAYADAHGYDRAREVIFGPFAGPFVLLSERAERKVHILAVQPDTWIAGHILAMYSDVHGHESIARLVSGADSAL